MSLSALLQEMKEICIAARAFEPLQHALGDVLDEAINVCRQDPVLKEHLGSVVGVLEDKRLRENSSTALALTEQTALYLLDTLKVYPDLLRKEIERAVSSSDIKGKKRLKFLANALGTELRVRGFSRVYLLSFASRLAKGPFSAELQHLLSLLDRPEETFDCFLPVKGPAFLGDLRLSHGEIISNLPDMGNSAADTSFLSTDQPPEKIFAIKVKAKDGVAAAQQALLMAGRALSLVALYAPNRVIDLPRQPTLVRARDDVELVGPDRAHESYIRDSHRLPEQLRAASPRVTELLAASLQYHALGVQASAPESRLTNFWVALESLLVDQGGSIIGRVIENVAPSLALSYCQRVLRAGAISLVNFIRRLQRNGLDAVPLRRILGDGMGERISIEPSTLAKVLLNEEDASRLFGLCESNPLLIFRLNQLREKLTSPKELKVSIERHHKQVCWQLGRIYRARNSLVHRGALPERSEHLIQHLHTYLHMTLLYLVREIGDSQLLTVPAAFARRRALYELYLSKIEKKTLTFQNLLSEATCWQTSDDPAIWANPPSTSAAIRPQS